MNGTGTISTAAQMSFITVISGFVLEAIQQMIPWLIVMFAVILCDMFTGCRKSILMGDKVRFSRAFRNTMGKCVTYFSFVVAVVFINLATEGSYTIDKWAILFICFIEGCSILANILKPKGYNVDLTAIIRMLLKKIFGIEKEDSQGIIVKNQNDGNNNITSERDELYTVPTGKKTKQSAD